MYTHLSAGQGFMRDHACIYAQRHAAATDAFGSCSQFGDKLALFRTCVVFLVSIHQQHRKYVEESSTHDHPDTQRTEAALREADKDLVDRQKAKEWLIRWHCFGRQN